MVSSSSRKGQSSSSIASSNTNNTLKCVIVGDGAVGKTCLLISYTTGKFPTEYVPTIFDNYSVTVMVGSEPWTLSLYDTAGQEDYDKLRPLSYPQADIIVLCYSIAHPTSFENLQDKWIPEIQRYCPDVPFLIVGTQMDLRDDPATIEKLRRNRMKPVTSEEGDKLARKERAVKHMECSAKTLKNVKDVFDEAVIAVVCPEEGKNKCVIA